MGRLNCDNDRQKAIGTGDTFELKKKKEAKSAFIRVKLFLVERVERGKSRRSRRYQHITIKYLVDGCEVGIIRAAIIELS